MKHYTKIVLTIGCIACLCLSSCSDNRPDYVPDNEEMASLLYDIHIMESLVNTNRIYGKQKKAVLYKHILEEHKVFWK